MKKLARPGFGIRLLSTLLCFILFVSLFAGILIADIRIVTTKENTSKIIRETLFISHTVRPAAARPGTGSGHGANMPIRAHFDSVKLAEEDTAGVMTDALVEFVYESMADQYGDMPISLEDVEQFVEQSTLKEALSDLTASLVNDMITGENTTVIDEKWIVDLVMDNAGLIEDYFGGVVEQEEVEQMAKELMETEALIELQEKGISQVLLESMTGGNTGSDPENNATIGGNEDGTLDGGNDENIGDQPNNPIAPGNPGQQIADLAKLMQDIRTALSISTMALCFGVAAACIILLFILNRKWAWYPLRRIGFTMIWAALPMLIPTLFVIFMADFWISLFVSAALVGTLTTMILTMTAPVCLTAAGLGVACIIASIIVKSVAKKKLKAETAAAVETPVSATPVIEEAIVEEVPAEEAPVEEAPVEEAPVE